MDKRWERTERSIREAFLAIRSRLPLERVTVKGLTERGGIAKATFYLHYHDVYELSERLQEELIGEVLDHILSPELVLTDSARLVRELHGAFDALQDRVHVLFSGTQQTVLPQRIENGIREYVFRLMPDKAEDPRFNTLLSYWIQGSYHAFVENYLQFGDEAVIDAIGGVDARLPLKCD